MRNILVNILIVAAIVLQSFSPIVFAQDFHQVDVEHLRVEHSHQDDRVFSLDNQNNDKQHNIEDCHHCGHCAGTHLTYVVLQHNYSILESISQSILDSLKTLPKDYIDPAIRPPIS